jgi:hypothetical protein
VSGSPAAVAAGSGSGFDVEFIDGSAGRHRGPLALCWNSPFGRADVDPILVPPPRILHLVSSQEIAGFLPPQLRPIPGAAGSQGAHLQADPALSLADPGDRAQQVTRWLCQIAADAGLTGMESLVTQLPPVSL